MSKIRLAYLDGLRGVAILMVVLIHTRLFGEPASGIVKEVINAGDKGVQLFFILSSLTLALSSEKNDLPLGMFYLRRLGRIWPLFAVATIGYAVLDWHGLIPTTATLLLLHGLSPTIINLVVPGGWYIGTLVIFYLLFPLLWKVVKNGDEASLWFVGSLAVMLVLKKLLGFLPYEYLYYYAPSQLPIFLLGFVAYFAIKEKRVPVLWYLILPAMIVAGTRVADYLWWGIIWVGIVVALAQGRYWLVENRLIEALGRVSYEIYLIHFAIYYLIAKYELAQLSGDANWDAILRWGMVVVGSFAVARVLRFR